MDDILDKGSDDSGGNVARGDDDDYEDENQFEDPTPVNTNLKFQEFMDQQVVPEQKRSSGPDSELPDSADENE